MGERIVDAWVAGDRAAALERLAELWAATQDVEVMELCERLSEQLVRARVDALERELGRERVRGELIRQARDKDRVAVHALLPWLVTLPRIRGRQQLAMLELCDPVLLRWLVDWHLRRPEINEIVQYLDSQPFHWRDRLWSWRLRDGVWRSPGFGRIWKHGAPRHRGPRALDADGARAVAVVRDGLDGELEPHRRSARVLLDAVYEQPADDSRKAVLADFLLAHDHADPRGEFIALQLRAVDGPLPERARERERELLDRHGLRWLGALAPICYSASVEFARGFLAAINLDSSRSHAAVHGLPIWATVERLGSGTRAIVEDPIMRSLRELGCDPDCAQALLDGPVRPGIERLTVTFVHRFDEPIPQPTLVARSRELFARLDALPNLRHLALRDPVHAQPGVWAWLWQGPRAGLESLRLRIVDTEPLDLRAWIDEFRGATATLELDRGKLRYRVSAGSLRITHCVPHWRQRAQINSLLESICETLIPALSPSSVIERIELDPEVGDCELLRAELRSRGVELGGEIMSTAEHLDRLSP